MPPEPTEPAPDIEGLIRYRDAFGNKVTYGGVPSSFAYDDEGLTYQCWGGVPHELFPLITCQADGPGGATITATFDNDNYIWSPDGLGSPESIQPEVWAPQPDLAMVKIGFGLEFTPSTLGCKGGGSPDEGVGSSEEEGFGCATPFFGTGEAVVDTSFDSATIVWDPWTGWSTETWIPGREPGYDTDSGGSWVQHGNALLLPPAPVYTDPDPLDPNIEYAPYLWNWADLFGETVTLEVGGDSWHRIRSNYTGGGAPLSLTIYPYRRIFAPSEAGRWMHVL